MFLKRKPSVCLKQNYVNIVDSYNVLTVVQFVYIVDSKDVLTAMEFFDIVM